MVSFNCTNSVSTLQTTVLLLSVTHTGQWSPYNVEYPHHTIKACPPPPQLHTHTHTTVETETITLLHMTKDARSGEIPFISEQTTALALYSFHTNTFRTVFLLYSH